MATLSTPKTSIATTTTATATLFDLGQALEALPDQQPPLGHRQETVVPRQEVGDLTTLVAVQGFVGDNATCPFCMEGLAGIEEGIKQAKCGHVFHDVCISTWVSDCYGNDSCPLCRCKIV